MGNHDHRTRNPDWYPGEAEELLREGPVDIRGTTVRTMNHGRVMQIHPSQAEAIRECGRRSHWDRHGWRP